VSKLTSADITHALLDLYITVLSIVPEFAALASPSPVSPNDGGSVAKPVPVPPEANVAFSLPVFWTSQTLTELKIHLRDKRPRMLLPDDEGWVAADPVDEGRMGEAVEGIGQNETTVRFIWDENVALA
jgi:CTD kinase subunit beta